LKRFLPKAEYERYSRESPPGWSEALTAAIRDGRPEPYGKNCQLIYVQMTPPLDSVTLTDRSDHAFLKGLLDKSVRETNEKLMGRVPEPIKNTRRQVALGVVLALVVGFALVFRIVMRTFAQNLDGPAMSGKGWRRAGYAYLIMAPALISVALWQYYPLVRGSMMAFQDYRLILPSRWNGLDNFAEVLFSPLFWQALWNSLRYMLLSLGLGFLAPIGLALLLHEVPKGKVLYRTLYYLPAVTTGLVIMFLWKQFYNPGPTGLLNQILAHGTALLNTIGIPYKFEPKDWLGEPSLAMIFIILPTIWAGMGPGCIIYLAALKSIPEDIYEAADLDGAGILSKVWNITVPYLKPLIIINFVGAFIHAARAFDFIFVMTGGGPVFSTHVAGLEIWYTAFMYLKFGYAVAMAWIVGALLVGFTIFQLRILSRVQFKTAQA
jgi:multiple sugar transport system permease protein